ncbi:MAG: hypothetical protein CMI02_15415 [Oceanospirillaceae bacterium]|nr:hypothetical protein [Oceanospirillaceae bacterium]
MLLTWQLPTRKLRSLWEPEPGPAARPTTGAARSSTARPRWRAEEWIMMRPKIVGRYALDDPRLCLTAHAPFGVCGPAVERYTQMVECLDMPLIAASG